MSSEILFTVEESPEGGFCARAITESIFVQADTVADLHAQVRDAVACHFGRAKDTTPFALSRGLSKVEGPVSKGSEGMPEVKVARHKGFDKLSPNGER